MANTSGYTSNFFSDKTNCKMQIDLSDSGTCSNGNRVVNYRIDRGLRRNVGGYYDGVYSSETTMHALVDWQEMKNWRWDIYWTIAGGRWPAYGEWWMDYQTGSFESTKKNGTYTTTIRWDPWGWTTAYWDLSVSLYIGGCCETKIPTGISGWASNVQAFRLTNNASITGWGTECGSSTTRAQESTISTKSYWEDTYRTTVWPSSTSTTMSYTHTGLTPNTKYYLDAAFRNKDDVWAVMRINNKDFSYSAITSLEAPTVRITSLDSRSINFYWAQNLGGKASGGKVYYKITTTGSSTSTKGSDVLCGSFTTSSSGTSISGNRNSWTDGFRLNPNTKYDLWVWGNNVRNSVVTKITFVTDRASTTVYEGYQDKMHSSVTLKTRRQNARYYDTGTSQVSSNVGTGQIYITTAANPDTNPGGFGKRVTYAQGYWNCRYIRLQLGPSTEDSNRRIFKWRVINTSGTDVAEGRTSISGWTNSSYAVNTGYNANNYANTSGSAWLTLDLGSNQTIRETIIYPYYYPNESNTITTTNARNASIRGYQYLNIQISTNNSTWTTVYSSGNTYGVATQATTKGDGTNPGNNQSSGNLLGYRVIPDSPTVYTTISNLSKSSLAISNNQRIIPGKVYNITSTMTDRHYATGWTNHGTIEFPVARRIKQDGSIIDYRLWRIRPNGQKFKMTGSIIDRSQD